MGIKEAYRLISPPLRKRLPAVVVASIVAALLDLVGIAALISVLLLVLDETAVVTNPTIGAIYDLFGFGSVSAFVTTVALVVLGVIIVKSLLAVLIGDSLHRFSISLYHDLSRRMFNNYLGKGLLFIRQHNTTTLVNNVNSLCYRFAILVVGSLQVVLTEAILLVVLLGALTIYNPRILALAAVVFIPTALIYSRVVRKRMIENGTGENREQVAQNKAMFETLRGYGDMVIGNAQEYVSQRFANNLQRLGRYSVKANRMRTISRYTTELSLVAAVVLIITVGLATGSEIGSLKIVLGVFAMAAYRMIPAINRILASWTEYKRHTYVIETLTTELADAEQVVTDNTTERLPFNSEIRLDNITFGYSDEGEPVLRNLSLRIGKGERIGIKGPSGSGKSTLFNIIAALIEPQSGTLSVDGEQITDTNRRRWQNNIAYVSQDLFLPDQSIAENVAFGIEPSKIDRARLQEALRAASLDELVASLPEGADTVTGEAGCRLSGGQRQRIGIARALYKQASVLLFDEATSSLDQQTAEDIVASIESLSAADKSLTILFISHNDQTLDFCERIYNLDQQ
ncbi:MAG: ABC transporter ATP-binding protein [Tidjanibacter sp.]|nr:ABC transporter ATP-binding protein [Tidjanibacter sp.]